MLLLSDKMSSDFSFFLASGYKLIQIFCLIQLLSNYNGTVVVTVPNAARHDIVLAQDSAVAVVALNIGGAMLTLQSCRDIFVAGSATSFLKRLCGATHPCVDNI